MNELDQYILHDLHIKFYTRYMDDFVLLLKTKSECIAIKHKIELFLKNHLDLELNDKSRFYPYKMGVDFCGYRIFTTHKLLRTNSKKKIKRNVKNWNSKFCKGTLDIDNTMKSVNAWLGHSSHCNSYKLQQKILNDCEFLYTSSTDKKIEDYSIYCSFENLYFMKGRLMLWLKTITGESNGNITTSSTMESRPLK